VKTIWRPSGEKVGVRSSFSMVEIARGSKRLAWAAAVSGSRSASTRIAISHTDRLDLSVKSGTIRRRGRGPEGALLHRRHRRAGRRFLSGVEIRCPSSWLAAVMRLLSALEWLMSNRHPGSVHGCARDDARRGARTPHVPDYLTNTLSETSARNLDGTSRTL
jgi:hypothetical protein